jgi:RND family efflux transporter MFP subunit
MRAIEKVLCALPAAIAVAMTIGFPRVRASADEPTAAGVNPTTLRTATVARGPLVITVNATGTLEPEETVDVGAQVTGVIKNLGLDPRGRADPRYQGKPIDFGSPVEKGSLLAQIDDTLYAVAVEQARAGCMRAEAELAQVKAQVALAAAQWQRAREQFKSKSIVAADFEVARLQYNMIQTSLGVAEASVAQSKAALKLAEINLDLTHIRSPIEGTIIACRCDAGQTVAAGVEAPGLFLIATDLRKLQVWASVNEADIAQIRAGQPVRFTADAYPREVFQGKVAQVRLNAAMVQNVVTYTVLVAIDNAKEKLLPYMTANVKFEVERRQDALLVPNAALHWRPQPQWIVPDVREKTSSAAQKSGGREDRRGEKTPQPQRGLLWVREGNFVRPIAVQIGLSDGAMTEIVAGDVKEGMEIIVGGGITMTDAGQGAMTSQAAMQRAIASMGANQLIVLPGTPGRSAVNVGFGNVTTLTPQDADDIARRCPAVSHVAPVVRARARIVFGNRNWVPYLINGTTPSFLAVRDWEDLAEGAAFTDADVRNANKVCLIGETLKRELFQGESPVGEMVRIQNIAFEVVGVLSRKGANVMGLDQDDIVLAPWTTIKYRVLGDSRGDAGQFASSGSSTAVSGPSGLYPTFAATQAVDKPQPLRLAYVDQIYAQAASAEQIPQAEEQITELLRQRHHIRPGQDDDFNIRDMTELMKVLVPRR